MEKIPKQEYTTEFKERAVKHVKEGKSIGLSAKELAELYLVKRHASLPEINARLADQIVSLNGKLEFPRKFVLERLLPL